MTVKSRTFQIACDKKKAQETPTANFTAGN
jgi:hypothetical protein